MIPASLLGVRSELPVACHLDAGRLDLDEYTQQNRRAARQAWLRAEGARVGSQRPARRRPRDPEEVAILTQLAKARLDRAIASGEFAGVEKRRYRLRVFG
jgi:hypothetical protein